MFSLNLQYCWVHPTRKMLSIADVNLHVLDIPRAVGSETSLTTDRAAIASGVSPCGSCSAPSWPVGANDISLWGGQTNCRDSYLPFRGHLNLPFVGLRLMLPSILPIPSPFIAFILGGVEIGLDALKRGAGMSRCNKTKGEDKA